MSDAPSAPRQFPAPQEFVTGDIRDFEGFMRALDRDQFAGPPLRGGIPRVMVRSALPVASVETRGRFCVILGGAGVADTVYCCLKSAANTYSWVSWLVG